MGTNRETCTCRRVERFLFLRTLLFSTKLQIDASPPSRRSAGRRCCSRIRGNGSKCLCGKKEKERIVRLFRCFSSNLHGFLWFQTARREHSLEQHSGVVVLVQMRQIIDVAGYVVGIVAELLQAQLEYTERDVLVLAAVVLHQGGAHEYVVLGSLVFARPFENGTRRLDSFRASRELHVLDVRLQ